MLDTYDTQLMQDAAQAVKKCRSGEPLTDIEIESGIAILTEVVRSLDRFGLEYTLTVNDLRRKLQLLEGFREARKRE